MSLVSAESWCDIPGHPSSVKVRVLCQEGGGCGGGGAAHL